MKALLLYPRFPQTFFPKVLEAIAKEQDRGLAIRAQFWQQLRIILRTKPQFLNMYIGLCAAGEHFWEYRVLARERIT